MSDGDHLEVEYVDLAPGQRELWLKRLVAFYADIESIDIDNLTIMQGSTIQGVSPQSQVLQGHLRDCKE